MKPEFLSRGRVHGEGGAHLFEGVDISGIYEDDDVPQRLDRARQTQLPSTLTQTAAVEARQARRMRHDAQARRSQLLEKAWIYTAMVAAFAVVIGIAAG
jgi:hypothetical protein